MSCSTCSGSTDCADALATELPYGQQRRLEIARALAAGPKLLLLDEPAAGMNPQETEELMRLIQRIRTRFELTILLIEHDMRVVMGDLRAHRRARLRRQDRRGHARRRSGATRR